MLQCRSGKRTGQAAFKIAVDLVDEGVVSEEDAMLMVSVRVLSFSLTANTYANLHTTITSSHLIQSINLISSAQVEPRHLDQLLHPQFADESAYKSQVCESEVCVSFHLAGQQVCTHALNRTSTHTHTQEQEQQYLLTSSCAHVLFYSGGGHRLASLSWCCSGSGGVQC